MSFLYATDEAMVYGVGGSKAPCSPSEARDLAAAADDPACVFYPHAAATLRQHDGKDTIKYILLMRLDSFKTQFSIKRKESKMQLCLKVQLWCRACAAL